MDQFKPYSIGERPGGYSRLRQKPRGLFGEPAWNSLGEYRRSSGVDSKMPPGMPSDVTRVDHARPEDSALGGYEPMPSGRKAAGWLGDAFGAVARGGRKAFKDPANAIQRQESSWKALGLPPNAGVFRPPFPVMPHLEKVDPASIKSLFPGGGKFWAQQGNNRTIPNTLANRSELFHPPGSAGRAEMDLAQSRFAAGAKPYGSGGIHHAEDDAVRAITGRPNIKPPVDWYPGEAVPASRTLHDPRLVVPQLDYRLRELGLGTAGAGAVVAGTLGAQAAGNKLLSSGATPSAPTPANPPPSPAAPSPGSAAPAPSPTGGLGTMLGGLAKNVHEHPYAYGLGAAGLGGGLAYLGYQHYQRKKREEEAQARLQSDMFSKSGSADDVLAALAGRYPTAAGLLARCGDLGYGEAEIRHTLIKAAGLVPGLADEFEGFFADAATVKLAFGVGFDGDPVPQPTPKVAPPPKPVPAPAPVEPQPAPVAPPTAATAPGPVPAPAQPLTNTQRAMMQARTPKATAFARQDRQMIEQIDRGLGGQPRPPAFAEGVRRESQPVQPAGPEGANNPPLDDYGQLARANVLTQDSHDSDTFNQFHGATTGQLQKDQQVAAKIKADRAGILARAGVKDGTPAADRVISNMIAENTSLVSRPQDDTTANAIGRGVMQVPEAAGALRTMPLAVGTDLYNSARGDSSFKWSKGNLAEFGDVVTKGLGNDPYRQHLGFQGTFQGLDNGMESSGDPTQAGKLQNSLMQDQARAWADSADKQTNPMAAFGHKFVSGVATQAPMIASMYGMAGLKAPAQPGVPGGLMNAGGKLVNLANKVPGMGVIAPAINWATRLRSAAPAAQAAMRLPGLSQVGQLGGALSRLPGVGPAAALAGRGVEMASRMSPIAAATGNKFLGSGSIKVQAGMQGLHSVLSPNNGVSPKAAPDFVKDFDPGTMSALKADPVKLQQTRATGQQGFADVLAQAKSDPNFDANKALPALEGPMRNLIAARCAASGEDPAALVKRYAADGVTPNEMTEIAAAQAGGTATPKAVQQVQQFFQNPETQGWQKALVGVGVPLAIMGALSGLMGGGLGSLLMSVLGLGAAAYGAHQGGLFAGTGAEGAMNSVFGGAPAATTLQAGQAPAAGGAGPMLSPTERAAFMALPPANRAAVLAEKLKAHPELAQQLATAHKTWNSGIPLAQTATGAVIRNRTGMADLKDEHIQALMDAYGGQQ